MQNTMSENVVFALSLPIALAFAALVLAIERFEERKLRKHYAKKL
jgi:hypothetical protein